VTSVRSRGVARARRCCREAHASPTNIACLADVVDEFVAVLRDAPDLHESLLDEEKCLVSSPTS
jgi:hypothetical protein